MYKVLLLLMIILISCESGTDVIENNHLITIDTVFSFTPGEGQNVGQSELFFPQNIFGLPADNTNENSPATAGSDILSLGLGGEIIIGFKGYEIVNLSGPDFTVFENAFLNPVNNKIFAEPATISVSYDGVEYFDFPFDSLTLIGCAGITPTNTSSGGFQNWGGDKFDLEDIGIERIKYIKIRDISKIILDNTEHPFYDSFITGFDLDAVMGINYEKK